MERHAPGPWAALGGALLLCLLPTLYNRIGHDTLFAHWLILWSLYVYFEVHTPRSKAIGWAANLTVASLVHPYLLIICLFTWGADQVQALSRIRRARDLPALTYLTAAAVISAALSLTALWAGGTFSGTSPAGDGFGIYSMGLDAPFNPSGLPSFLSFLPKQEPRQAFEGFQYLGVGILLLIGTAWWLTRRARKTGEETPVTEASADVFARARALKWVLIVLTVLAVSTKIQIFGKTLVDIPLPEFAVPVAGVIRASGRLFWPVAYILVFLSLIVVYRSPKRHILLGAAVGLQLLDVGAFAGYIKGITARASDRTVLTLATRPEWEKLIRASTQVNFVPPNPHISLPRFYEVTYRAVSAGVPVNTMYAARPDLRQEALEFEGYSRFLKGEARPDQLYVYLNPCPPPAALRLRLRELDGYWILPPASAATIGRTPVYPTFPLNQMQDVARDKPSTCGFGADWALAEETGIWTRGDSGILTLPEEVSAPAGSEIRLTLNTRRPSQVTVFANDAKVGAYALTKKAVTHSFRLPQAVSGGLRLRFVVTDPPSADKPVPAELKRVKISQLGLFTTP